MKPVELLQRRPEAYDVVVTDYDMPDQSGLLVAKQVLACRPDLVVVLQSGYVTEDLNAEAEAAGVKRVLHKETAWRQLGSKASSDPASGEAPAS